MIKIIFISTLFQILFSISPAFSSEENPEIINDGYKIEKLVTGLNVPIALDFIDNNILVLQKNDGMVRLIQNDVLEMYQNLFLGRLKKFQELNKK